MVTGSVQIRDGDGVFNRLLWATPDGELQHYDKRHLFRMAGEHERYAAGRERLIVELKGWRICPLVCYDLRFPVFIAQPLRRASVAGRFDYDLLLFVANWPCRAATPGSTLLRARAIENLAYVAAVNRVGTDGNGHGYSGDSVLLDGLGEVVVECGDQVEVLTATLSAQALLTHRERFPAQRDADRFQILD